MATNHFLKERLEKAFTKEQAEILAEVISESYNSLVKQNDFNELKEIVKDLALAQKRTEERVDVLTQRMDDLTQRVDDLTVAMKQGFQKLTDQISALGSRWGIKNETMLRNTLHSLLSKHGYTVTRGFYGGREIDILIHNGEHILLEVTSAAIKKDVRNLNLSAEEYFSKNGIEPRLMLAAVYISPVVMREIVESPRRIEVYSGEEEDEE